MIRAICTEHEVTYCPWRFSVFYSFWACLQSPSTSLTVLARDFRSASEKARAGGRYSSLPRLARPKASTRPTCTCTPSACPEVRGLAPSQPEHHSEVAGRSSSNSARLVRRLGVHSASGSVRLLRRERATVTGGGDLHLHRGQRGLCDDHTLLLRFLRRLLGCCLRFTRLPVLGRSR